MSSAPSASSIRRVMTKILILLAIVGTLAACSTTPLNSPVPPAVEQSSPASAPVATSPVLPPSTLQDSVPVGPSILQAKSRWTPVRWQELPGWEQDALHEAWNAWLKSCERPSTALASLCPDVRRLSIASVEEQRAWMVQRLQPYRVEPLSGASEGLLTGYYEPQLAASRMPTANHSAALYRPPANLAARKPWFSRQEIDTLPEAKAALQGRALAYLSDPIDVLVLQIQGSGRLRITEPDGSQKTVRVAYAGTNEQPYKSVGRWLLDQGLVKDASWPGIKAWLVANPQRAQELLWSNPRVVFFREEALPEQGAGAGPKGAQGVALTAGRSIAVDAGSIPYGAPVWMASSGPTAQLQRLVLAQDTGSAILGAVRADYFAGTGAEAGELAGRLKQPLKLWVLWPKP
jgi:membrane-bound lytic murein transglycosylase A